MFKLPTTIRYSVYMLAVLAQYKERLSTNKLAKLIKVSPLYLRQIAIPLEQNGFIKSYRGAKGGYIIAKDPADITLYDIFKLYKEDLDIVDCIDLSKERCKNFRSCITRPFWIKLNNLFKKFLKETTLKLIIETKGMEEGYDRKITLS